MRVVAFAACMLLSLPAAADPPRRGLTDIVTTPRAVDTLYTIERAAQTYAERIAHNNPNVVLIGRHIAIDCTSVPRNVVGNVCYGVGVRP